jgi:glucosamine--fructose-6-phosphate aminotransferase (isomerizing)
VPARGSPLAIGHGATERCSSALTPSRSVTIHIDAITYLEEGDWAVDHARWRDDLSTRPWHEGRTSAIQKSPTPRACCRRQGQSSPFHGQGNPRAARRWSRHTLERTSWILPSAGVTRDCAEIAVRLEQARTGSSISACGTAYYAGLVAKYWFERFARLPVEIDVASEFRYREIPLARPDGLALFVSQSGETADTLASLRYCREAMVMTHRRHRQRHHESTIARESDMPCFRRSPDPRSALPRPRRSPASSPCWRLHRGGRRQGARRRSRRMDETASWSQALNGGAASAGNEALRQSSQPQVEALVAKTVSQGVKDVLYLGRGTSFRAGDGGRAEAQGNQLHPRRRLCRRRIEARTHRAHRRDLARES